MIVVELWTAPWCGLCPAYKTGTWQIIKDMYANDTRVTFNIRDYDANRAEYNLLGLSGIPAVGVWKVGQSQAEATKIMAKNQPASFEVKAAIDQALSTSEPRPLPSPSENTLSATADDDHTGTYIVVGALTLFGLYKIFK